MNIEKLFPHFVTLSLLVMSAIYRSPVLGAATVVALGLVLGNEILKARYGALTIKTEVPEELKRQIHDIAARVTTIEYGIKTRGF